MEKNQIDNISIKFIEFVKIISKFINLMETFYESINICL